MVNPTAIAPVATSMEVQPPSASRAIMSRPLLSQPSRWPEAVPWLANGPRFAQAVMLLFGSPHVTSPVLARMAISRTKTTQPMAIQVATLSPGRPPGRPGTLAVTAPTGPSSGSTISPAWARSSCSSTSLGGAPLLVADDGRSSVEGLAGCSGTTDPWVQHGVEEVDDEVHQDEEHRDDHDVALQRDVLAGVDGLVDLLAHAGDPEDDLDDDGATDQGADVEARDGHERETRRSKGVAPQDPAVRDALCLGERDE